MNDLIDNIDLSEDLLEEFRVTALALQELKAKELDLRQQITDVLLEGRQTGTHNFSDKGFKIKAVKGINHSFDKEMLTELIENEELSPQELDLIRWKPELKLKEYKGANFETTTIDDVIIVKPSLPTLKVVLGE